MCIGGDVIKFIRLKDIIPLDDKNNIQINNFLKSPTIYVIKEVSEKVTKKLIENSVLSDKICNFCFDNDGCCKFFDPEKDHLSISESDYFISFGDVGDKTIEELKRLKFKFNIFDSK